MSAPANAQSVVLLDAITVLATKTAEKAIDSLSAVSVADQTELDRIAPRRIEDVLVTMPGVWYQASPDSPEAAVNIRGLQDFGRVAVIVDGARQNFQRSGHNANGTFLLDPELLSQMEIVRGPVANIYGSGAIGGVASFSTKDVEDILRPGERWGGQVHSMITSNPGNPLVSAFGALRMTPNLEAIIGGSWRHNRDYTDGNGTMVHNSGYDLASGLAKVTVRPADGHQVKLSGIRQTSTFDIGSPSVYDTTLTNDIVSGRWTYSRPEDRVFDFDGSVYWTRTLQEQTKIDGTNSAISGNIGDERSFQIDTTGFDLHNTSRFETEMLRHALTYGGDFFEDRVEVQDATGTGDLFTPNGKRTVGGAFAQWRINYSTWLEFIAAARYDDYHLEGGGTTADGDHISPKATLGITPWQGVTFYGTYAEGYRAPAVTETLVAGAHPPVFGNANLFTFVPNPDLKPEVGQTKEFGVNLKFDDLFVQGDRFRAKANVFRNDVDDYIEQVAFGPPVFTCPAPIPGCPPVPLVQVNTHSFLQYRNIGHARIEGVELEATYDQGDWFFQAAGSHIRGEDVDAGIPLATIPPDKLALTYGMRFLDRKFTAMVRWIGVDDKRAEDIPDRDGDGTPDLTPTGGYGLVNLYFAYEPNPDVQITFAIDNVFDLYYTPYLSEGTVGAFAGPGITFKGGIKVRFGESFYKQG